tara:strand:- start:475 stop:852 length:378 start_codon:yes stop_codon:yes gene_type:complete
MLMLIVVAVVVLCYCGGGKYCPKVLRDNKEILLGVLVGMALCSFAGLKLEGMEGSSSGETSDELWEKWVNEGCCSRETGKQPNCMNMLGLTNVSDLYQKHYPTIYGRDGTGGKCSTWCEENPNSC